MGGFAHLTRRPICVRILIEGKVIEDFSHMSKRYSNEYGNSETTTIITFFVDDSTVITRWIGESNGYYSEDVSIKEICS